MFVHKGEGFDYKNLQMSTQSEPRTHNRTAAATRTLLEIVTQYSNPS